jgi:hypothetical protein
MSKTLIDKMVDRFLCWNLPNDFAPDCYVSFNRELAEKNNGWPTGTNLLTGEQARQMFEHVIAGEITKELQPHQKRVMDEKSDLDKKANALSGFIGLSPLFETLDAAEQNRLREQNEIMWQYSEILGARIAAFTSAG